MPARAMAVPTRAVRDAHRDKSLILARMSSRFFLSLPIDNRSVQNDASPHSRVLRGWSSGRPEESSVVTRRLPGPPGSVDFGSLVTGRWLATFILLRLDVGKEGCRLDAGRN
jgi:hypothetical protein